MPLPANPYPPPIVQTTDDETTTGLLLYSAAARAGVKLIKICNKNFASTNHAMVMRAVNLALILVATGALSSDVWLLWVNDNISDAAAVKN